MRNFLGRLRRSGSRSLVEQLATLTSVGDGSTLTLDFTTGVLDQRLTFTRDGGGTYTGNDGLVYGMDFATSSSLAIGTGSKSVTLTATAGVDRRYLVGQTVWISNGANNMRGPVTAYNASTQVLTIDATGTSGSGSFTSWTVGNASARFDHDPTTLAPRGLLIEAAATNLLQQSADWTVSPWSKPATITWDGTTYATAPDGTTSAKQITVTGGSSASIAQAVTTGTNRTISLWLRAGSLTSFSVGAFDSAGTTWGNNVDSTCSIISGPGSVTQQVGGLWSITGLSTTQWTRVQIFRSTTYTNLLAYPGSSSGTINGTAYVWGMQMEAGNRASSLIPTTTSTATRNPDICTISGAAFSSWYNASEGTFFAHFRRRRTDNTGTVLSANDNTTAEVIDLCADTVGTFKITDGGSSQVSLFRSPFSANTDTKIAGAFKLNDCNMAMANSIAGGDATATIPTVDRLFIGRDSGAVPVYLDGHIRTVKFYDIRKDDGKLQEMTA